MKFLIDAQLPPSLKKIFENYNYDVIHTLDLPLKNDTPDSKITKIAIEENRILITKDSDFYDSFLLKKEPPKLILVKTGNISTKDLKLLFQDFFEEIIDKLAKNDLIILNRSELE